MIEEAGQFGFGEDVMGDAEIIAGGEHADQLA